MEKSRHGVCVWKYHIHHLMPVIPEIHVHRSRSSGPHSMIKSSKWWPTAFLWNGPTPDIIKPGNTAIKWLKKKVFTNFDLVRETKPLLFPILYHILKFISVSLGTDLSIVRQSSVNSLVCDGSTRWGRSLIYTRNNIGPSIVPCVLCPKSQVWCVMISFQDQPFYPSHRETIGSIQRYSHRCRFLGSFSKIR